MWLESILSILLYAPLFLPILLLFIYALATSRSSTVDPGQELKGSS